MRLSSHATDLVFMRYLVVVVVVVVLFLFYLRDFSMPNSALLNFSRITLAAKRSLLLLLPILLL